MKVLVNCTFRPQFGYRAGKEYAYLWDTDEGRVEKGQHAVVETTPGLEIVKVVSVEDYKPMPYAMKWLVAVIDMDAYKRRK